MKQFFIIILISFSHNVLADFRFTHNNHTYDVITNLKTWKEASIEAGLKNINGNSGYLVHINDELENQKITAELITNLPEKMLEQTHTFDAGYNLAGIWIGANDINLEGTWRWVDDNVQFWSGDAAGGIVNSSYSHWGEEGAPFNYKGDDSNGQDAAVIRVTEWIFGRTGQWDDVSIKNSLFNIIEYDDIGTQINTPFYKNSILMLPSVFVADANGCFHNYMAKLELAPSSNPLSFSLFEAQLLSTSPNCNISASDHPLYQNGILKLPNVSVFDGAKNSVPYEAELSLTPFSTPLSFELVMALKLTIPEPINENVIADFSITSPCNPAIELPCTVTVLDQSIGLATDMTSYWVFSDEPDTTKASKPQNPINHVFTIPGTYLVTHSIGDKEGNFIDEITKEVIISKITVIDEVFELQLGGFNLADPNGVQLTLASPSDGGTITNLSGEHARRFNKLEQFADCPLCLIGYATYSNYVDATFWYQSSLGGWDSEKYPDGAYSGDNLSTLHAAVTMMSWALKNRMDELMSCSVNKARKDIPERYTFNGLIVQLDTDKLRKDLNYTFFFKAPYSVHIAIGAFSKPLVDNSITLGVTWSSILDSNPSRTQKRHDFPEFIDTDNSVLIGINSNVHSNADSFLTLGTSAGTIFHELLHNFGFGHGTNDLSSYDDRSKALFALEDCMCNIVKTRVEKGSLPPDSRGLLWLGPEGLSEKKCNG